MHQPKRCRRRLGTIFILVSIYYSHYSARPYTYTYMYLCVCACARCSVLAAGLEYPKYNSMQDSGVFSLLLQ